MTLDESADWEERRVQSVCNLAILDTEADPAFDNLAEIAARAVGVPICLISLVDQDRQWSKASFGIEAGEAPRCIAFCSHAIQQSSPLVIEDASQDARFADNPQVTCESGVCFYAGFQIHSPIDGMPVGTLCVVDSAPRSLEAAQFELMQRLAKQVEHLLSDHLVRTEKLAKEREIATAAMQAENLAEESEGRFRILADSISALIWTTDLDGTCPWLNQRWFDYSGRTMEQETGYGWTETVHPDDRERIVGSYQAAFEKQIPFEFDYRLRRHDGEYRLFHVNATPRRDRHGNFLGYVGMSSDVHDARLAQQEQERLNQELQATNAELEQFAYIASHDLKQPLRGIDSLAQFIAEDTRGRLPAEAEKHLSMLRARVRRLDTLLDDLLEYSRVGRGTHQFEFFDTAALIDGIRDEMTLPGSFAVECVGDLPTLQTARIPLSTVLRNLIGNAMKHRQDDSGWVRVSASQDDDWISFRVQDNGPGIAPEYHERIFRMFHTLRPRDEVEGSGMGLALVRKIVESFGGSIRIESELGHGATFIFTWPMKRVDR